MGHRDDSSPLKSYAVIDGCVVTAVSNGCYYQSTRRTIPVNHSLQKHRCDIYLTCVQWRSWRDRCRWKSTGDEEIFNETKFLLSNI